MRTRQKCVATALPYETSYIKLYDEFVDEVYRDHGVDIISRLRNTPGMPEDNGIDVAFIQQYVAVSQIARRFGCLLAEERLTRGVESPPRDQLQTTPVSVAVPTGFPRGVESPPRHQLQTTPVSVASPVVLSPCRVVLTDIRSPDSSPPPPPPVGQSCSRRAKRKMDIERDEDEAAPTPKRNARPRPESSADSSESQSESPLRVPGQSQQAMLTRKLEEAGLHLGRNVKERLRKKNPFLVTFEAALKAGSYSIAHINNMCDNMARIMKFYTVDNNPYSFQLSNVTNIETLHRLSQAMVDAGMAAETKLKYLQALDAFLERMPKSGYRHTHAHLMTDFHLIKDEVKLIKKRVGKMKMQEKTSKMADMALTKDTSAEVVRKFSKAIQTKLNELKIPGFLFIGFITFRFEGSAVAQW